MPQDQSYYSTNGFKQEVRCAIGGAPSNVSVERGAYVTFQSCPVVPGDFMSVVKFEFWMIVLFVLSFSFATKRKKKLLAIQQYRISTYM